MTDVPKWLSPEELRQWQMLAGVLLLTPPRLDDALSPHELTFFEYSVLVILNEAPERKMPTSELAKLASGSLSRTSHLARRLEARGLLRREQCAADRRVTLVALTAKGCSVLQDAAPTHVASVRNLVFDALPPALVAQLAQACERILRNQHPELPLPGD